MSSAPGQVCCHFGKISRKLIAGAYLRAVEGGQRGGKCRSLL